MVGGYLSVVPRRFNMTHRVFRVGSRRVGVQRTRMDLKVLFSMPTIRCMFSFDFRRRLWLTIIRRLTFAIWCIGVSGRIPHIHFTLSVWKHLIHITRSLRLHEHIFYLLHRYLFQSDYILNIQPNSTIGCLLSVRSCSLVCATAMLE